MTTKKKRKRVLLELHFKIVKKMRLEHCLHLHFYYHLSNTRSKNLKQMTTRRKKRSTGMNMVKREMKKRIIDETHS